jgi:alpha-glucosidase
MPGCRTPMQWTLGRNAGFSTSEPWLPLSADFRRENVWLDRHAERPQGADGR